MTKTKAGSMNICIFMPTGRTFSFKNVTILSDNETAITFEYTAMSDSLGKTATFYKSHVAGVSHFYS